MTDNDKPLVSISCTTYNHENYIAEALDGFLLQETSFPIEILVHDDASTDRTADIIRNYAARYPKVIKPILQAENQFSKGLRPGPQLNYPRALGRYIAICEGDDYWTDPHKLQKQVDYLESHPKVFFCAHAVRQIDDQGNILAASKFGIHEDRYYSQDDLAMGYVPFPTLSVLFRNEVELPRYSVKNGDLFTFYYFSNFGDAFLSREIMGVHRVHQGGIWSSIDERTRYEARLETMGHIPPAILPSRRSLAYLAYFVVAKKDHRFGRKLRNLPFALLMALIWLRPTSARAIARRLIKSSVPG